MDNTYISMHRPYAYASTHTYTYSAAYTNKLNDIQLAI